VLELPYPYLASLAAAVGGYVTVGALADEPVAVLEPIA
jgi:hypothetical protein